MAETSSYIHCARIPHLDLAHTRLLLKISGELFSNDPACTFTSKALDDMCATIKEVLDKGVELAMVVGAGNIVRGKEIEKVLGFDRASSDLIGMYATVVNGLTLHEALRKHAIPSCVMAPDSLIGGRGGEKAYLRSYNRAEATALLQEHKVVICTGGTGNPFFTTDSAAVLRGLELDATLIVKATKVNGVYSSDPTLASSAQRYSSIRYKEAIEKRLSIMDQTAFLLASEHRIPLFIYKYGEPSSLFQAMASEEYGTFVLT